MIIEEHLAHIAQVEGISDWIELVFILVALESKGSMRDAIKLMGSSICRS